MALNNWKGRLAVSSFKNKLYQLNMWLSWMKDNRGKFEEYSLDELIDYQKNADNGSKYEILDLIQQFTQGIDGTYNYKSTI